MHVRVDFSTRVLHTTNIFKTYFVENPHGRHITLGIGLCLSASQACCEGKTQRPQSHGSEAWILRTKQTTSNEHNTSSFIFSVNRPWNPLSLSLSTPLSFSRSPTGEWEMHARAACLHIMKGQTACEKRPIEKYINKWERLPTQALNTQTCVTEQPKLLLFRILNLTRSVRRRAILDARPTSKIGPIQTSNLDPFWRST